MVNTAIGRTLRVLLVNVIFSPEPEGAEGEEESRSDDYDGFTLAYLSRNIPPDLITFLMLGEQLCASSLLLTLRCNVSNAAPAGPGPRY